jgi:SAM-dependent methyltransferase
LTLFQAVEDIEKHKKDGGKIQAYGLTASPDYLFKGVPPFVRDEILRSSKATGIELRREELLLNGVQNSEQDGYYRESPAGNMMRFLKADAHFLSEALPDQRFDLIYSSSAYPHFSAPWLAFEQACNALREGGVAMIDSLPTTDIVDVSGKPLSPEQYQEVLQRRNPAYRVHFKSSSHPFSSPIVVERTGEEGFYTGLYLASVTDSKLGISKRNFANIYTEGKLQGYTPLSVITAK